MILFGNKIIGCFVAITTSSNSDVVCVEVVELLDSRLFEEADELTLGEER